jgi:hypothetical protein
MDNLGYCITRGEVVRQSRGAVRRIKCRSCVEHAGRVMKHEMHTEFL